MESTSLRTAATPDARDERYQLSDENAERIRSAEKVVSIGTTTARVLEHLAATENGIRGGSGATDIFIYPGFTFRRVDALLTNFHLPKSTLMMLVSALMGTERMAQVYAHATQNEYRFFSYGDASLLMPKE